MIIYYFILTAISSSIITIAIPHSVVLIRQYKTHKQRKLTSLIATEVAKQLKDIIND
jgi:hypothetical protein